MVCKKCCMCVNATPKNTKHNLSFSTDNNPQRSKTKCMAFLKKERQLRGLKLCNNVLPWVGTGKHLGMRIDNIKDIFNRDILEKRARYIQGNNQLMQEFSFASCLTKIFIIRIYNGHHFTDLSYYGTCM